MAIVALINLLIVIFDLTYTPLRNFWLLGNFQILNLKVPVPLPPPLSEPLPRPFDSLCRPMGEKPAKATLITQCYDPIKGIETHRDTAAYLATVDRLQDLVNDQGRRSLESPDDPEVTATLQILSQLSADMISSNPFETADKSGTLEKIKNLMRDHMEHELKQLSPAEIEQLLPQSSPSSTARTSGTTGTTTASRAAISRSRVSATAAFRVFWSPAYLNANNWKQEMAWFDTNLRPLLQTNYYRTISENGLPTNHFWAIDAPFVILFLAEFLARTFYLSRRSTGVSWVGAMVWRWYDIPLFFPFGLLFPNWAWLRILPVTVRLHQSRLVDMHQVREQATQGFVSSIAEELTEVVVIQVIDQTQAAVQRGDFTQLIAQATKSRVDINNVDEVAEISKLVVQLLVYQVLPKVQPDLEALLSHTVESVLKQSPAYQTLKNLPGFENLQTQFTDRLVKEVTQASYNTLTGALEDPIGAELTRRLIQHLGETLRSEIQRQQVLPEMQPLLIDLLEEIKLSYVQRSTEVNAEKLMEETRQLRQISRRR